MIPTIVQTCGPLKPSSEPCCANSDACVLCCRSMCPPSGVPDKKVVTPVWPVVAADASARPEKLESGPRRRGSLVEVLGPDAFNELVELCHELVAFSLLFQFVALGDDNAFCVQERFLGVDRGACTNGDRNRV